MKEKGQTITFIKFYLIPIALCFFVLLQLSPSSHSVVINYIQNNITVSTESIELPYTGAIPRGEYEIRGTIILPIIKPSLLHIIPDDCLLSLEINGEMVPLDEYDGRALCNYTSGVSIAAQPFLRIGQNEFVIRINNAGGPGGISIYPSGRLYGSLAMVTVALLCTILIKAVIAFQSYFKPLSWNLGRFDKYALSLLIITVAVCFSLSVWMRAPYFGRAAQPYFEDQSARSVKFARNWYREGLFSLRFLMLENPASIEFDDIESRVPYISYPPGAPLLVYMAALLQRREPSFETAHLLNLAGHFTIAIALLLASWYLMRLLPLLLRMATALTPALLYIFLPGPMVWHQSQFFATQASVLPYVLAAIFGARLLGAARPNAKLLLLLGLCLFWLTLTDWLGLIMWVTILMLQILIWRLKKYELRELASQIALTSLPVAAALLFYAIQLFTTKDALSILLVRLQLKAAPAESRVSLMYSLWHSFWRGPAIADSFGPWGPWLVLGPASVAIFLLVALSSSTKKTIGIRSAHSLHLPIFLILLSLPALLHVLLLPAHQLHVAFSTHKFSPLVAAVPFVLLPFFLLATARGEDAGSFIALGSSWSREQFIKLSSAFLLPWLIIAWAYLMAIHPTWKDQFGKKVLADSPIQHESVAQYLYNNMQYDDVVFSPNILMRVWIPPQLLALSMKRIHIVQSFGQIANYTWNDYQESDLKSRNQSGTWRSLDGKKHNKHLIVSKGDSCWLSFHALLETLEDFGETVFHHRDFAHVTLSDETIRRMHDTPLCAQ